MFRKDKIVTGSSLEGSEIIFTFDQVEKIRCKAVKDLKDNKRPIRETLLIYNMLR